MSTPLLSPKPRRSHRYLVGYEIPIWRKRSASLPVDRIGIKATTNEGLGFLGRREGIAALAVAALERK